MTYDFVVFQSLGTGSGINPCGFAYIRFFTISRCARCPLWLSLGLLTENKQRRITEIFLDFARICPPFWMAGRRMYKLLVHSSLFVVKVELINELENKSWIPAFAGMTNNKYQC